VLFASGLLRRDRPFERHGRALAARGPGTSHGSPREREPFE
jgi:hypothetical protein